jgi:hypothetical protein
MGCTLQQCARNGEEIRAQLSSDKWYYPLQKEFERTFVYPADLVDAFKNGKLRQFAGYDALQPPYKPRPNFTQVVHL